VKYTFKYKNIRIIYKSNLIVFSLFNRIDIVLELIKEILFIQELYIIHLLILDRYSIYKLKLKMKISTLCSFTELEN